MPTAPTTTAAGTAPATEPGLKRVLGPKLLILFVVGDILGTGICATTGKVAGKVGGALWLPGTTRGTAPHERHPCPSARPARAPALHGTLPAVRVPRGRPGTTRTPRTAGHGGGPGSPRPRCPGHPVHHRHPTTPGNPAGTPHPRTGTGAPERPGARSASYAIATALRRPPPGAASPAATPVLR